MFIISVINASLILKIQSDFKFQSVFNSLIDSIKIELIISFGVLNPDNNNKGNKSVVGFFTLSQN